MQLLRSNKVKLIALTKEMDKLSASLSLNLVKSIKLQVEPISLLEGNKGLMKWQSSLQLGLVPKLNNKHHLLPNAKSLLNKSNQTMAKKLLTSETKLRAGITHTKKTWSHAVPSIPTDQRSRLALWARARWVIHLRKEGIEGEEKDEFDFMKIKMKPNTSNTFMLLNLSFLFNK